MKSSTIRRANLTKEKIAVIEALANYKRQTYEHNSASTAPVKARELDILWQHFKANNKNDKSPGVYLITGFIAGAVIMLLITTILSMSLKGSSSSQEFNPKDTIKAEKTDITFIPADNSISSGTFTGSESYTVQSGDTLEAIIIRFYGSYSSTYEKNLIEVNKMRNRNALQIGQKLIIPLH